MTKQQQAAAQSELTFYEDLLLKRYRIVESVIEEARKFNSDHGIDDATSKANAVFTKTNQQKKFERFLKQCVNPTTNKFYTMEFLKAKQIVSGIDSQYDGRQYPRREMFQLYRIKEQSGEYLMRREMWYGLNVEGKELSMYVETLDDHRELQIEYVKEENHNQVRYMGVDDDVPGYGKTIAKVRNTNMIYTDQEEGKLVYDTIFSQEAVDEALKHARGKINDHNNGLSLGFIDGISGSKNSATIPSIERFLEEPFDKVFQETIRPKDKVDIKDLVKQLRDEELLGKSKEIKENPYQ
jgi:hypothetical protein